MDHYKNLADLAEVRTERGNTLLHDQTRVFLTETPKRLNQIRSAITGQDFGQIAKVAHILRASSSYLDAYEMTILCENLEKLASRNDQNSLVEVKMHLYAIEKSFVDFKDELCGYLANLEQNQTRMLS